MHQHQTNCMYSEFKFKNYFYTDSKAYSKYGPNMREANSLCEGSKSKLWIGNWWKCGYDNGVYMSIENRSLKQPAL